MRFDPIRFTVAVFLTAICLPARPSWGWNATGHKIVAMIAWEDLTPKTRAEVTAILMQHPRYEQDLKSGAADAASADQIALHAFAQAATWPDMVRSLDNPMHALFNHPIWHYIDIPYVVGTTQPATQPADDVVGPHDIVEALTQCTAELKDPKTPADKKAVDLCWIEHLVGDIHQPLHAVSLFSARFPHGDQGGNAQIVLKQPPYPDSRANLHSIWDSLAGDFASEELVGIEAGGLRRDAKYSREQMKDLLAVTDFLAWANESHALAISDVYLDGNLHTAESHGRQAPTTQPIPGLPAGYMQKAEHVAMHQLPLAGYRLADLLNSIFDPA